VLINGAGERFMAKYDPAGGRMELAPRDIVARGCGARERLVCVGECGCECGCVWGSRPSNDSLACWSRCLGPVKSVSSVAPVWASKHYAPTTLVFAAILPSVPDGNRSIQAEMAARGEPCVWLDISHKPAAKVRAHFPNIAAHCEAALGLDITRDPIPVRPAQHYTCGGVLTGLLGEVPGVQVRGVVVGTGTIGGLRSAGGALATLRGCMELGLRGKAMCMCLFLCGLVRGRLGKVSESVAG
jgi:hypothetical protein